MCGGTVDEVLECPYFWFCLRYGLSALIFAFCSRFLGSAIDVRGGCRLGRLMVRERDVGELYWRLVVSLFLVFTLRTVFFLTFSLSLLGIQVLQ